GGATGGAAAGWLERGGLGGGPAGDRADRTAGATPSKPRNYEHPHGQRRGSAGSREPMSTAQPSPRRLTRPAGTWRADLRTTAPGAMPGSRRDRVPLNRAEPRGGAACGRHPLPRGHGGERQPGRRVSAPEGGRRDEAAELALDQLGKAQRRAVLKVGADDLHADR